MATEYRGDRVTLLVCHNRKPGMDIEEFRRHWREVHSTLFMSMDIAKKNLLKYEQLHPNPGQVDKLAAFAKMLPYDGAVIFQARSYEDIMAVFQSDEYKDKVVPDEERFVDRSSAIMLPCDLVSVYDKDASTATSTTG